MDVIRAILLHSIADDEPKLPPGLPPTSRFSPCPVSPSLTSLLFRQVRGSVVYDTNLALLYHRALVFPDFLVLSPTMAVDICTQDHVEGYVPCVLVTSRNSSPPDFSPHEAHAQQAFFGWIIPTLKVSEYTVLQIVGLDAAVVSSLNNI